MPRAADVQRLGSVLRVVSSTALRRFPDVLDRLEDLVRRLSGPRVQTFTPGEGRAGCALSIDGFNFSADREANTVAVGGRPAIVVSAAETGLTVLTDPEVVDGPVEVTVGSRTAVSDRHFRVLGYPADDEDGPPILFTGEGEGLPGDLSPTGTTRVLVALVNPTDRVPSGTSTARQDVIDSWQTVRDYYDQASFATKTLQVDVPTGWTTLSGTTNDYCDLSAAGEQNIKQTALDRLTAEAAKACQDAGYNLNNYGVLAVTLFLNGAFIRAWGGWDRQTFSYDPGPGGTKISITLNQPVNLLAIQESADWGRLAHEVGHNFVAAPSTLPQTKSKTGSLVFGEDVYGSDLVDPNAATAARFELMGDHDDHPLFSAYHMEKLGWYRPDNAAHDGDILDLTWNRNPFSQDIEITAHGGTRNTVAGRYHAVKIKVADGLFYYLEVRQRPGTVVFDDSIPFGTAPDQGGLVVTQVVTDTVNNNQQARFITLLHDPVVLFGNDTAVDPARALTISVLDDGVVSRPLVCRVRVAWAQGVADDPKGAFDLSLAPWDRTYTTPDIWVDRLKYGVFDKTSDADGRPQLNGDKPKPGEVNKVYARIHVSGTVGATNAKVTFYVVEPPGVGDNGNWSPLVTKTIGNIATNGFFDLTADWVPIVGRHTCLKVYVSQQFGEVTGGNNWAQENVAEFEAAAFSPPAPVVVSLAVRNPREEPTVASINISGVPRGYQVQFPHAWVHLQGHEERLFDMVVVPYLDVSTYVRENREVPSLASVVVSGAIPRQYSDPLQSGQPPGSVFSPIGGVLSRIRPVRGTRIELSEDERLSSKTTVAVHGGVSQAQNGDRVRVVLEDAHAGRLVEETATDDSGYFEAQLDLDVLAREAARGAGDVAGRYTAQAHTFAADTVAEASSNVITIDR